MSNSESIRYFTVGREAVPGFPAATMNAYPFLSVTSTPKKTILQPKEFRGTRGLENVGLAGVQMSETKIKVQGYYDLLGWILSTAFNTGTDATLDTTAKSHIYKTGAGSVPSNSLQYSYGVGTAAAIWEQEVGAMVEQIDFTFAAEKLVEVDVTWVSPMSTIIGAPSTPTFSIANYVHPMGVAQQSVSIAASGFTKLISAKISVKNNRAALYTMNGSADPARFIEGPVQVTFDFVADWVADTASFYNNYRTNTLPGLFYIQCQDTTHLIGATTAYPTLKITIPNPRITSGNLVPNSKGNTEVSVKGTAEYDTGTSSICTAELDNVIASYPGS